MNMGIYMILNVTTEKYYIGRAFDLDMRWRTHKSALNKRKHPNEYLQFAWNKYGQDDFKFFILELIYDKSKIIEREQHWIDYLQACNREKGFNLNPSAANSLGFKHSAETIEKIRANTIRLGLKPPDPTGRKHSEASKLKMSIAMRKPKSSTINMRKPKSEEHKANLRLTRAGFKHTEESKRKISEKLKGNKYALGMKHTDEAKRKISEGNKKSHDTKILLQISGEICVSNPN